MNEDAIIRKLRRYSKFIGDDCAVIPAPRNQDLLLTTDFTIETVHFTRDMKAEAVGHKACARSLSDIAAMGGKPLYCLVSLALAPWVDQRWIDGFYRGLNKLLRPAQAWIAGGDFSHAEQLVCNVTVCGVIAKGKSLLRRGAKSGDALYVSGPLGGWRYKPAITPRLDIGRKLVGKATSCMDISDGLALDLHRLCLASGVSAELDSVPLLAGATLEEALHDGEDYELLYTAPPKVRVPGIQIGMVVKGKPGSLKLSGKRLEPKGYDPFRNRS